MHPDEWVQAENYPTPAAAGAARASLEMAGIEAQVFDAETGAIGIYINAIGGIRLMVRGADLETARKILAEDHSAEDVVIPDEEDVTGTAPYCARCHSRDLEIRALDAPGSSVPGRLWRRLFGAKRALRCRRCGYAWRQ